MNLGSSQQTPANAIAAVGKSPAMPAKSAPGFFKAYETAYRQKDQREEKQDSQKISPSAGRQETAEESDDPEIFKLLKKYRFKDFFELAAGIHQSKLKPIIKKSRKSRGICHSVPVSHQYRKSNDFIDRMSDLYNNANWLMRAKPGKLYNQML